MWSVEVERQEIKSQVARHCYLFCKQKLFSLARGRGPGGMWGRRRWDREMRLGTYLGMVD